MLVLTVKIVDGCITKIPATVNPIGASTKLCRIIETCRYAQQNNYYNVVNVYYANSNPRGEVLSL